MQSTLFSTDKLPIKDRADYWQDTVCSYLSEIETKPDSEAPIHGRVHNIKVAKISFTLLDSSNQHYQRKLSHIKHSNQDSIFVDIQLKGSNCITQNGQATTIIPGDYALTSTRVPFSNYMCSAKNDNQALVIEIPRTDLGSSQGLYERDLWAKKFSSRSDVGYLFTKQAQTIYKIADELSEVASELAAQQLYQLLNSALFTEIDESKANDDNLLFLRIDSYISDHFTDTNLNVSTIASAHNISSRKVFRLFAAKDTSPQGYIWQKRALFLRDQLVAPCNTGKSITEISFFCGFNDSAHCSRFFKKQFEYSPRDYRNLFSCN